VLHHPYRACISLGTRSANVPIKLDGQNRIADHSLMRPSFRASANTTRELAGRPGAHGLLCRMVGAGPLCSLASNHVNIDAKPPLWAKASLWA
jgi:hypothetical protein